MQTTFENLNIPGVEIWAASVEHLGQTYRVNVSKAHNNLPACTYVFEIAEGDGFYTDIVAKGFGPDAVTAMRRSITKCREMAHDQDQNSRASVALLDEWLG